MKSQACLKLQLLLLKTHWRSNSLRKLVGQRIQQRKPLACRSSMNGNDDAIWIAK